MTEKMTEREKFYYDKGYSDGRIAIIEEIMKGIYEVDDCLYNDDYASGYNTAIANVIDVIDKVVGDSVAEVELKKCPFCGGEAEIILTGNSIIGYSKVEV